MTFTDIIFLVLIASLIGLVLKYRLRGCSPRCAGCSQCRLIQNKIKTIKEKIDN